MVRQLADALLANITIILAAAVILFAHLAPKASALSTYSVFALVVGRILSTGLSATLLFKETAKVAADPVHAVKR